MAKKAKRRQSAMTPTQQKMIDKRHYGDEPVFSDGHILTDGEKRNAYNWYRYMCDKDAVRSYLTNYLKTEDRNEDLKKLKSVADIWLPNTAGYIARLIERGAVVPIESLEFLERKLSEAVERSDKSEKVKESSDAPSVHDRIREKVIDFIGEIEEKIDNEEVFSLYEELNVAEFPSLLAKRVADFYRPQAEELRKATKPTDDADLKDGYKHLGKSKLKSLVEKYEALVTDADRYSGNVKKVRAPRKKKVISADKKVAKLNYLKEHNELQLHSINPTGIIGATSLWVYNTKAKRLTVYYAEGHSGLDVKGSTIIGFDAKTSETKTIGRVEKNTLTKVLDGGKIILRRLMSEVNTNAIETNGRINKDTIIMRITK